MPGSRPTSPAGANSAAHTIAASRSSFEKESVAPPQTRDGSHVMSDAESSKYSSNEKNEDLAKVPTSASRTGSALQNAPTRDDGSEYPTGPKLAIIIIALCLSVFLMALDNSIIATAIPKITDQFHSLGDVGWYGSCEYSRTPFGLFPPGKVDPMC